MDREMCKSFGQTPLFAGLDEGARGIIMVIAFRSN
jgi:hypothetical protein